MADVKMVAGLGNPGSKYDRTRHNAGFDVVDLLAERLDIDVRKKKFGARFGEGHTAAGCKLILLKPWQYMNCSGHAIATAAGYYQLELVNLLVVSDDMALEPGRIRLRGRGSSGGHNGLSDIIEKLSTQHFSRCRVGIGSNQLRDSKDFVLSRAHGEDAENIVKGIKTAAEAVEYWLENGIEAAMNRFN